MFVYIRSAAFVIVVTQKLVLQQSKNVTAKCTETLSPPLSIQYLLERTKHCTLIKYILPVNRPIPLFKWKVLEITMKVPLKVFCQDNPVNVNICRIYNKFYIFQGFVFLNRKYVLGTLIMV